MLKLGRSPRPNVFHLPDTCVWSQYVTRDRFSFLGNVIRVQYYTSVTGDSDRVAEIEAELSKQGFTSPIGGDFHFGQLVPVVFKKPAKSNKTRNIDIQIVIDIMRFAFTDSVDRNYLASGDGDYIPLIKEVMRRGKQVELLAFSSGLNPALSSVVDRIHKLDDSFFLELEN